MSKYITDLDVSFDGADEQRLRSHGFTKINADLNKGTEGNSPIYLWYKSGSTPITRIQITFNDQMAVGLINAGYTKIPKNLNAGNSDVIYLWYFKGQTHYDTPIVEIDVTTDVNNGAWKFSQGWERLACDLNRNAGGDWIHIWVKREKQTYICDVTATDSYASDASKFEEGYIRVDEDTNRQTGAVSVFIWYRQSTDSAQALSDLQISTNDDAYQGWQRKNYQLVNVNLNEGTGGNKVYLWYKKESKKPIKGITLLLNPDAVDAYERVGLNVIKENLNAGNKGSIEYLCVYQ